MRGRADRAVGGASLTRAPDVTVRMVGSDVLRAFRDGDHDAVRELYAVYGRLVYTVAYRALGRRELAEEAVQQTFVQAWQACDRIDVDRDPGSWFATIAKRVAIDIYRRESRRAASALDDVSPDARALVSLPPELATLDAAWHVRSAIEELPDDVADVVRLQHLEGMTHAEIAERLHVPVGTVKSRSHRAHGKLAKLLGHLRDSES